MKRILLLAAGIIVPLIYALKIVPQQVCIPISDRRHLPQGIYDTLKKYRAILIGEMHGTKESPEFVDGMVNLWLNSGEKVLLGLEMSKSTQGKIDSFMSTGDFTPVKKSPFFYGTFKSGISSVAMADLIKSFYKKPNVKIVCICNDRYYPNTDWDSTMAVNEINALKDNPGYKLITLTGNLHNKMEPDKFGTPMGYRLYRIPHIGLKKEEIASVDVVYDGGTAWNCAPDCGIHKQEIQGDWHSICNCDNFFTISMDGRIILYTKNVTASLPLNP